MKRWEKLQSYIEKVKKDACAAEGRPYRRPNILVFINAGEFYPERKGEVTIFLDSGKYGRVGRRMVYRLERNVTKYFPELAGVRFNMSSFTCAKGDWYTLEEYYEKFHPSL